MILRGVNRGKLEVFTSSLIFGRTRGQLTIFILVAIFILGSVVLFFAFRDSLISVEIPGSLQPVYNTFLNCLEEETLIGIDILETQAGYIDLPEFEPGSSYMPFSSQLNFLGNPIPYWYYVSGNNIQREQIPSKKNMEEQLGIFIGERIRDCEFDSYYAEGFEISLDKDFEVNIDINDENLRVSLDMDLSIFKEDSVLVRNHNIVVNSELGALYNSAREVYNKEQDSLFLEDYAVDTLRLYAPVDGVEIQCSPLVWNANDIFDELENAIEANTLALNSIKDGYFVQDFVTKHSVRFINDKSWPSTFEVSPSEGSALIANPVGTQPGLGSLGFCYVPYHFVYDVKYPVLVQISNGEEIFQFPLAVVIQGNRPREAIESSFAIEINIPELCSQKNTLFNVNVFDNKFNPLDAEISYECSGTSCRIGTTNFGELKGEFPQCINGFISARADGFVTRKQSQSIVDSGTADLFLDRLYEMEVKLKMDNQVYSDQATISFISENNKRTIIYPDQRKVNLSQGQYEVQVYIYRESSLNIAATKTKECVEVPQSGLGGFFGFTREKCFDFEFPAQIVSNALAGGGKQNYFILESELENSNIIEINADSLPLPNSIERLQDNYLLFEDKNLDIAFK